MSKKYKKKQEEKKSINWTTTILKLALLNPMRGSGQRFWEIGSHLFLCFSAIQVKDKEGVILEKGFQLCDEVRNTTRRIDRYTAKTLLRGIILDIIQKDKKIK
jgi:hypothetical protein